ncbi:MAG: tRNA guanosine(34) transglycosylase Tgt [Candidatus Moraniibacteriota bacterium]
MFTITERKEKKRSGTLQTRNGVIQTPFFMPIATRGAVKHMTNEDLRSLGAEIILGNTYHLWLRPGDELISRAGDLHAFMNWNGPILTDSGGFQVFSLGARAGERFGVNGVKITEEGVEFIDPTNGNKYFLSPEKSIDIQLNLGSDVVMVLDECPPYPCTEEYALNSLERTTRWAKRAKEHFEKKLSNVPIEKRPLLFGIVQGSLYPELRKKSALELTAISFDGYAIGGVAVGEPRETLPDVLAATLPYLPEDKPRYLMGLGRPEEIVRAVEAGVDMFDCVIPTREGRHGRLFYWTGKDLNADGSFYTAKNLTAEEFKEDFSSIDADSDVKVLREYTKSYLRHQFAMEEPLAGRLATLHNLRFYLSLMEKLRG